MSQTWPAPAALGAMGRADLMVQGAAERAFAGLAALPGAAPIGYRKLKRRMQHRAEARFRALARALGPGDIALDLGANVGDVTALLAEGGAQVHAYEPEPETAALLSERFADHPNVEVHREAVATEDGTQTLILPPSFSDAPRSASKAASIALDRYRTAGHRAVEVATRDIRGILAALPRPPALIKMDVEGAELDILGALQTGAHLAATTALFVETHERLDPVVLPRVRALQAWARSETGPGYLNLYWG